jgi:hypothetical protein
LVLGVLLDGTNGSNCTSVGSNLVLESDGKKVSLVDGKVIRPTLGRDGLLKETNHIIEFLGLLGNSGQKDFFFEGHF